MGLFPSSLPAHVVFLNLLHRFVDWLKGAGGRSCPPISRASQAVSSDGIRYSATYFFTDTFFRAVTFLRSSIFKNYLRSTVHRSTVGMTQFLPKLESRLMRLILLGERLNLLLAGAKLRKAPVLSVARLTQLGPCHQGTRSWFRVALNVSLLQPLGFLLQHVPEWRA